MCKWTSFDNHGLYVTPAQITTEECTPSKAKTLWVSYFKMSACWEGGASQWYLTPGGCGLGQHLFVLFSFWRASSPAPLHSTVNLLNFNANQVKHFVFQDEGSSSHWQLALEGVEVMLCERVPISSQRSWSEADGVGLCGGNPLTQFYISVSVCRTYGLCSNGPHFQCVTICYFQNRRGVSAKNRDSTVEELWGLTSFFVYSTQTFVQAVNLLDRFLTVMKVGTLEYSWA